MSGELFRITYSRVASFNRCRKQYWFRYLSGLERPEERITAAGCIGTGVHRALRILCETGDAECAAQELDAYLRMPVHEIVGPGTEANTTAVELFKRGCVAHASIDSKDRWAELDTWAPLKRRGVTVQARIDRVDRLASGQFQVIDWKTGRYDYDDNTDAQLDLGHLAIRIVRRLPREAKVTAIAWNLRTERQRVRVLSREHAIGTLQYYAGVAERIQQTAMFEATPGPACAFCEWREICDEAARVEAGEHDWLEEDEPEDIDGELHHGVAEDTEDR